VSIGAGIGAKIFFGPREAFNQLRQLQLVEPTVHSAYEAFYQQWLEELEKKLN